MPHEFIINATWSFSGDYHVQADSLEEAIEHVQGMAGYPEEYEYVEDSHQLPDEEVLAEINEVSIECCKIDQTPKDELPLLIGTMKTEEGKHYLEERMKDAR